jgi:hypothetical protein
LVRLFWPGLLSIVGSTTPLGLAWFWLTAPSSEVGDFAILRLTFVSGFGVWGFLLLGFSISFFLDPQHAGKRAAFVAVFYGLGSYFTILESLGVALIIGWPGSILPIAGVIMYVFGFAAGIWAYFKRNPCPC